MKTKHGLFIRYGLRHTAYRLFETPPRGVAAAQRGAILPLVAIGIGALLAMAGLALDMGHDNLNSQLHSTMPNLPWGRRMYRAKLSEFFMRNNIQFNLIG